MSVSEEEAELIRRILLAEERKRARNVLPRKWLKLARPNQLPPASLKYIWMILAGRGWGKSRTGGEWIADYAQTHPGSKQGVMGLKWTHTAEVPFMAVRAALDWQGRYNQQKMILTLDNGAQISGYSAEAPDAIRGPNLERLWLDEMAAFPRLDYLWNECAVPAVRIGDAQILITTTPKPKPLIIDLASREDGSVVVTRGAMWENAANLSAPVLAELKKRYDGTRIGRQELYGELLDEVEGALWSWALIEAAQMLKPLPTMSKTIVSVDPSGSASGDATGIVTLGRGADEVIYVLADDTTKGGPEYRYEQICLAAIRCAAGTIVYEAAYGGDNVAHGIRSAWRELAATGRIGDEPVPHLQPSPTKTSKADRADPVVALYEQTAKGTERIKHAAALPELESEMTGWEEDAGWSPNHIDALVHGVRYLAGKSLRPVVVSSFNAMPDLPHLRVG